MKYLTSNLLNIKFSSFLVFTIFYTSVFSAYLNTSLISIFFILISIITFYDRIKFTSIELISLLLIAFYSFVVLIFADNIIVVLQNIRFWLGIVFYILFFKLFNLKNLFNIYLFRILFISIIGEAILINVILDPHLIYTSVGAENHKFFGFYYRPMGFAGNASLSVSTYIALFIMVEKIRERISFSDWFLLISGVILFFSGTGFMIFLVYLILRLNINFRNLIIIISKINRRGLHRFLIFLLTICSFIYLSLEVDINEYQKLSSDYFTHILNLKINEITYQINYLYESSVHVMLLGNQIESVSPATTGHNGLSIFLGTMGILGLIFYVILLFSFLKKENKKLFSIGIFVLLLSSMHYPSAMTSVGQLILAGMLMINTKNGLIRND